MSIFSNLFRSEHQNKKEDIEEIPSPVVLSDNDIPDPPLFTKSIEERCRRDNMVNRGFNFTVTSDLTFIDENGNCIHL